MGKRSNFDRKDKDFYETPQDAVEVLAQQYYSFSTDELDYFDPCYGGGAIERGLDKFVLSVCLGRFELTPEDYPRNEGHHIYRADATFHDYSANLRFKDIRYFITNPPWTRFLLHAIIDNLAGQKPTWLLFDADWMHTKQSAEYMKYCVKVVSIGRVKWFPDSKHTGKENCCWYLFDKNYTGATEFIGR